MNKKIIVSISVLALLILMGGGFWVVKNKEGNNKESSQGETVVQDDTNQRNQESTKGEGGTSNWKTYRDEKYGFKAEYPEDWVVQSKDNGHGLADGRIDISWQDNQITLFPTGKMGSSCYTKGDEGDFEQLHIDKYAQEFFVKTSKNGKLYRCSTDMDNYPKNWNEKAFIEMDYDTNISNTVKSIVQSISFLEDTIDATSLKIYGSRVGIQREGDFINTSNWLIKKDDTLYFSFSYPQNAKIMDEGNCYRVKYKLGFVMFHLPKEGGMRCGARTGVGILPDNVDVTEYLTVGGEKYEAPGFHTVVDTKGEKFFKPETRYFYDFHHMFKLNKNKNCRDTDECISIEYGIYEEVSNPLSKKDVDNTMNTLRAIVESVNDRL